jgi:hypothetical protein
MLDGVDALRNWKTRSDGATYPQSIRDQLNPHIRGIASPIVVHVRNDHVDHNTIIALLLD